MIPWDLGLGPGKLGYGRCFGRVAVIAEGTMGIGKEEEGHRRLEISISHQRDPFRMELLVCRPSRGLGGGLIERAKCMNVMVKEFHIRVAEQVRGICVSPCFFTKFSGHVARFLASHVCA